ncbi:MAG: hypothetical protein IH899_05685 [Planctomycetes bacterium]|nr:hypothetical protein [Planctomycetota bacterium]
MTTISVACAAKGGGVGAYGDGPEMQPPEAPSYATRIVDTLLGKPAVPPNKPAVPPGECAVWFWQLIANLTCEEGGLRCGGKRGGI